MIPQVNDRVRPASDTDPMLPYEGKVIERGPGGNIVRFVIEVTYPDELLIVTRRARQVGDNP